LDGEDRGVGADRRSEALGGALGIVRLHAEENEVRRPPLARVVGGPRRDREVPDEARAHRQPVRAERAQVRAARDEGHVLARACPRPPATPPPPSPPVPRVSMPDPRLPAPPPPPVVAAPRAPARALGPSRGGAGF